MRLTSLNENSEQGYDKHQSNPVAVKRRTKRNKARREAERAGKVKKGDGKHVHHKKPLSKGGSNKKSNLSVTSANTNWKEGNTVSTSIKKNGKASWRKKKS